MRVLLAVVFEVADQLVVASVVGQPLDHRDERYLPSLLIGNMGGVAVGAIALLSSQSLAYQQRRNHLHDIEKPEKRAKAQAVARRPGR